jgi:hypothetical protein
MTLASVLSGGYGTNLVTPQAGTVIENLIGGAGMIFSA